MRNTIPLYLPKLVRGELSSVELPKELDLSLLPADIIQCLIEQTLENRLEHGKCIVWLENKQILRFMHKAKATPEKPTEINPTCDPNNPSDHSCVTYVGFFHTHIPDEDGKPLIGFSEKDYRATLADGDNLSIVYNGWEFFTLVRVHETRPRGVVSKDEYKGWVNLLDEYLRTLPTDEAQRRANLYICRETRFAFYHGMALHQLRRVLP